VSIAFSVGVYLTFGLAMAIWLKGQGKSVSSGAANLLTAIFFWPAYLPVCLAPGPGPGQGLRSPASPEASPRDPIFRSLEQQIARLGLDAERRTRHLQAVERLERALASRGAELERLGAAKRRLVDLRSALGGSDRDGPLVDEELARLEGARRETEQDLGRVRESIVRLTLRLEVFELRASKGALDEQLAELSEELDRLLDARHEVEVLAADVLTREQVGARDEERAQALSQGGLDPSIYT
jgi:hypothetical protein